MTIDYANDNIRTAFVWQRRFMISLALFVFTLIFRSMTPFSIVLDFSLSSLLFVQFIVCVGTMCAVCYFVYEGSVHVRGLNYSILHVLLILGLSPVLGVGVILIPGLVNGDLLRDIADK